MPQEIGQLYRTLIPSLSDDASIEQAFSMYHYGTAAFNGNNVQPNSIERHFIDIASDINDLRTEVIAASAGTVRVVSLSAQPNIVTPEDSVTIPITIRGVPSQSVALQRWQKRTGSSVATISDVAQISNSGQISSLGYISVGSLTPSDTTGISLIIGNAAHRGITIRGVSGQSGNLQEWLNNNGDVLASVSPEGNFATKNVNITGTLTSSGTLTSNGNTATKALSVDGALTVSSGNAITAPSITLNDTGTSLTTSGSATIGNGLSVSSGVTNTKNISADGTITASGTITSQAGFVTGTSGSISAASLSVGTGGATISSNTTISGTLRVNSPGNGTSGGLRILADGSGNSYIQFMNNGNTAEVGNFRVNSTNFLFSLPIATTSLTVSQAFNASNSARVRNVWSSTATPVVGSNDTGSIDGDVWLVYI